MLAWQTEALRKHPASQDDRVVHLRPEFRYRPDKRPEDADTIDTGRKIYEQSIA
jgi:hypothetical protein